jgi:hypothetical protein
VNPLQQHHIDATPGRVKKAYSRPQLEIYGELREITKSLGCLGDVDNIVNTLHCGFQLRTHT